MQVGDVIPLFNQAADYSTGLFMKAFVFDDTGTEISGSPVIMNDLGNGAYDNQDLVMPNSPVNAQFLVYTDDTYTDFSTSEGANFQFFDLTIGGGGGGNFPPTSNIVGIIDGGSCSPQESGIQETIVKGSDRTVTVRLIQDQNGLPFDLTDETLLEFRFRKADGTVLSVKSSDAGTPVEVVNAPVGQLLCVLTKVQTALLFTGIPSPFTIVVTQPLGVTVINLPTQLAVEDQDT